MEVTAVPDRSSLTLDNLGATLRQARLDCAMSPGEAAHALSTSRTTIYAYESGRQNPGFTNLLRMLDLYGLDLMAVRR